MSRYDIKLKIKNKERETPGFMLLIFMSICIFLLFMYFFSGGNPYHILFYLFFGGLVFIIFKKYLVRFYINKKRIFLRIYQIILHPLLNITVLSLLFWIKIGMGAGIGSSLDLLIGSWILLSVFLILSVTFIWSSYFGKGEENHFQTFWIYHLGVKRMKQYIFMLITLFIFSILFFSIFIQIILSNILGVENAPLVVENIPAGVKNAILGAIGYLTLMLSLFFILFLAMCIVVGTVEISPTNIRKYSKICLSLIKERFPKIPKRVSNFTEEYAHVFPEIIEKANHLLKRYHVEDVEPRIFNASYPPKIINSDNYSKKLLIADLLQDKKFLNKKDKKRLKEVRNALNDMDSSLDIEGDGFLLPFADGLTRISNSGEDKPKFGIEDWIEFRPPTLGSWVNENPSLIGIFISAAGFIIILLQVILRFLNIF